MSFFDEYDVFDSYGDWREDGEGHSRPPIPSIRIHEVEVHQQTNKAALLSFSYRVHHQGNIYMKCYHVHQWIPLKAMSRDKTEIYGWFLSRMPEPLTQMIRLTSNDNWVTAIEEDYDA